MEMRQRVIDLMARTWDIDAAIIKPGSLPMRDLGIDSLDMAKFLMELEDELGVRVEGDEDEYFRMTVEEIVRKVEARTAVMA